MKSNRFLTVVKEPALVEKRSMRISLNAQGSEAAWFYIHPVYKLRASGENVSSGGCGFSCNSSCSMCVLEGCDRSGMRVQRLISLM